MGSMPFKEHGALHKSARPALEARDSSLEQTALLSREGVESLPLDVTPIPRSSGLLSELELDLTENYDATALLGMMARGEVSAQVLLGAFRKRATIAQQCVSPRTRVLRRGKF